MKRYLHFILCIAGCVASGGLHGYGQMNIRLHFDNYRFDSVKIQAYDAENTFKCLYVQPFKEEMLFKSQSLLAPGIYWIFGDTTMVEAFFISSKKNQKFSISIDTTGTIYRGSPENSANLRYINEIQKFERQMDLLNIEFQKAKIGGVPPYMMQVLVDSLTSEATRLMIAKTTYQQQVIKENPGTLLASVIQATIAIPELPRELYDNKAAMQTHVVQHFFDNFPWGDTRIYHTPVGDKKIRDYAYLIYQFDRLDLDTFVVAALDSAKINTDSYFLLFDKLEKILGDYMSPYKVEHTYIRMLKNSLTMSDLKPARRARYERELQLININLQDSLVPNFNIVLGNGDTTNLYAIHSDYLLLYLEHPTCSACMEARNRMADYPVLNHAIDNGRLKVLTVYFESDSTTWRTYLAHNANPDYLHGWNYDLSIDEKDLFDTRSIPYMFLLDSDKRVIKKNLLINEIEDYIRQLDIR